MRMEFDERRLKQMAAVKWRLGPEEWPVSLACVAADVIGGYVTQLKCVVRRTPEEMERILGLRRAQSAKGAGVLWLGRLPDWEEFALGAYKRCRGWATYDEHGAYPLGLAAVGGAVFGSAWAASHRRTEGLQGKCNITLELKEDEIVIIHGLTYVSFRQGCVTRYGGE